MNRTVISALVVFFLALSLKAASFEAGLFSPIQVAGPEQSIDGARLGLFYTKNQNVNGLDLNFFVGHTAGNFSGVRIWGLVNYTEGSSQGVSIFNGANVTRNSVEGARVFSFINYSASMEGADVFALANISKRAKGVQVGFVNYAEQLEGFQIGFINIAMNSSLFPVLPLINFSKSF